MWTGSHPTSSSAPRNRSGRALFLVGVVTVACSSSSSPPHDAAAFDIVFVDPRTAICGDAAVSRPPYAVIQQIIDSNCLSCHFAGNDLVLTHDVSWTNLVGRAAPESCGGVLVVPGDPGASYLYQKLTSPHPCSGTQMPAGEFGPVPLPDCVVGIVREWIAAGAVGPAGDAGTD
jgi:hypothetical protein